MTQQEASRISYHPVIGGLLDDFLSVAEGARSNPQSDHPRSLAELSLDKFKGPGISHLVAAFTGNVAPRPLLSILRIARKRYSCFAICETPYFDLEDWDGYSVFYSRSFTPFTRTCSRIHLFEGNEKNIPALIENLREGVDQKYHPTWLKDLCMRHRGYFVLRPYRSCVVGKTVIEFDERPPDKIPDTEKHPLEQTGRPFCTGKITNVFHLSSLTMSLDTAPAVQQNPVVGVCATASVWVASQVLAGRFGLHKYSYNTITRQALCSNQDVIIAENSDWKLGPGLTLREIKQALARTGCVPFICGPSSAASCSSQARMRFLGYTFVESGLPVIAAYSGANGGHAVTIVGHLLPGREKGNCDAAEGEAELTLDARTITKGRHLLLGQSIQLYYCHNDAYGPFDRIRLLRDDEAERVRRDAQPESPLAHPGSCPIATWRRKSDSSVRSEQINSLQGFVVPLPPYVQNNRPEHVILDAITRFDRQFPPQEPDISPSDREKILWRCFLASAPDFKQSVVRREYSSELRKRYVEMHLPLFVWVVEFTILPPMSSVPFSAPRPISGEFLYDSTTPFYEPQCMVFRCLNLLRDFRTEASMNKCGPAKMVKCFIPVETRR